MSTGTPSPFRRDRGLSPTTRFMLLTWVILFGGGWIVVMWLGNSNKSLLDDLTAAKDSIRELSDSAKKNKVEELRRDAEAATARLESLEQALAAEKRSAMPVIDTAPSVQAVERAKLLALAGQLSSVRENLLKLKALQATWQAQSASISSGDLGRRIASSIAHLGLAIELMEKERTSPEKIREWESRLEVLAEPVEKVAQDEKSRLGITVEHAQLLSDLNRQVLDAIHSFQEQQLLLEAIAKETAGAAPHAMTFDEIVHERRRADETAQANRLNAARTAAREEAVKAHVERTAQLEAELIQAKTKLQEQKTLAERDQLEALAKAERDQIAEETRVKEAQRRATIAGLKEEASRVDEALRQAQLEREFERDKSKIQGYLSAFTTPGYSLRSDGTKGPVSLSFLKGKGALESTREGMFAIVQLARSSNDRPIGAIPVFATVGDTGRIDNVPIEIAQALLTKYGDLMVKKGLLAP